MNSVKRVAYLGVAATAALMVLVPTAALAQDAVPGDDDPLSPEQNVVVLEHDELEKTVGERLPQQVPDEPIDEPGGPAPKSGALPKSGGVYPSALLLPAAALLVGSGLLAYAVLRRRR